MAKKAVQKKQPGHETVMHPKPEAIKKDYKAANKLEGKVAVITGGDSGIGKAVALAFAKEGADIAFIYLDEHKDAEETKKEVEKIGKKCFIISTDIGVEKNCIKAVQDIIKKYKKIDILINNAAEQHSQESIEDITEKQLEKTFRTNVYSMFFLTKAVLKHLKEGSTIVNTTSVTAYRGSPKLLDYSSTKGAIVAFTRSLAKNLAEKKIRVNAVAPGPIWTPLIPATFPQDKVDSFGKDTEMKRAGQPSEVSPCYVFLASDDSSYITGQVLHPNGGDIING